MSPRTRYYPYDGANDEQVMKTIIRYEPTWDDVLDALGAHTMVVGHTIQSSGINQACEGQVLRVDVRAAVRPSKRFGSP